MQHAGLTVAGELEVVMLEIGERVAHVFFAGADAPFPDNRAAAQDADFAGYFVKLSGVDDKIGVIDAQIALLDAKKKVVDSDKNAKSWNLTVKNLNAVDAKDFFRVVKLDTAVKGIEYAEVAV